MGFYLGSYILLYHNEINSEKMGSCPAAFCGSFSKRCCFGRSHSSSATMCNRGIGSRTGT